MLHVQTVTKVFGKGPDAVKALDGVSLKVEQGEFITVVGPSGCGKTTLLRMIAGFEHPDSGEISIDGRPVVATGRRIVPAHDRGVGVVPQEGALFPHLSVAQNVGFGLARVSRKQRSARVHEVLELVGLASLAKRRPNELSGGQQQRVALARALAPGPNVVLLDEPFSALDEYLRESLRDEVRALLAKLGTTAILVTHDQEEALALGDRVAVMRGGRIIQIGEPRQTYFRPADLELARFLGDAVVIDGKTHRVPRGEVNEAGGLSVSCAFGELPVAEMHGDAQECAVLIRPENIQVLPDDANSGLSGTVLDRSFYGHDGVIRVQVPGVMEQVAVRIMGDHDYPIGSTVRLAVERPVSIYAR